MKETKVYIDELPESCDECKYYTQFTDGMGCIVAQELRPMDECDNYMQASCPLHSLKTHDRELVKKVCGKIRSDLQSGLKKFKPKPDDVLTQFIYNLDNKLDQIEKEFENE